MAGPHTAVGVHSFQVDREPGASEMIRGQRVQVETARRSFTKTSPFDKAIYTNRQPLDAHAKRSHNSLGDFKYDP
jgi:hypothetical protein